MSCCAFEHCEPPADAPTTKLKFNGGNVTVTVCKNHENFAKKRYQGENTDFGGWRSYYGQYLKRGY